jgi:hypothetical protein
MLSPVLVAQKRHQLRVRVERYLFGQLDRVQVGNQRNRKPIVSGDTVITAKNDAQFPVLAPAELKRSVRANPV